MEEELFSPEERRLMQTYFELEECLEPEELIGLIEHGDSYPDSEKKTVHVEQCPWCSSQRRYWKRELEIAAKLRAKQEHGQND